MSSIIVRGLDDAVKKQLALQAQERGRSMEAEARDILTKSVRVPNVGVALLNVARDVDGAEDLQIPPRSDIARAVDFG